MAEAMFESVRDGIFSFHEDPGPERQRHHLHAAHVKDTIFMMPTPMVLLNVVDQLNMADHDIKGHLYEYMLSKIATAGQNGQFCTSRHIIDLMVKLVAIRLASIWMSQISGAFRLLVGFAHLWTFGQGALFGFTQLYTGIHRLGGAAPLLTASLRPDASGRKTRTYEYGASVG